jgi:hypothetical protein
MQAMVCRPQPTDAPPENTLDSPLASLRLNHLVITQAGIQARIAACTSAPLGLVIDEIGPPLETWCTEEAENEGPRNFNPTSSRLGPHVDLM